MSYKQKLLRYGLRQRYYTVEEFCWIMNGNKLEDFEQPRKRNKLEEELDIDLLIGLAGSLK